MEWLITRLSGITRDYTDGISTGKSLLSWARNTLEAYGKSSVSIEFMDEIRLFSRPLDRHYVNSDNGTFLLAKVEQFYWTRFDEVAKR